MRPLFDDLALPWFCAGVDEVGRGPLAGPVVAGAVVLDTRRPIPGLRDSKRLNAAQRARIATEIRETALAWALGRADVAEIDQLNILRASHLAMQRAVAGLALELDIILVDGNLLPAFDRPAIAVIKGDDRVPEISAGAIIAKVDRDLEMIELDAQYPGYGFARNKGYPTAQHREALRRLGPCPLHRSSFAPVRDAMEMKLATQPSPLVETAAEIS
jgi:ribonuclease HII